MTIESQSDGMSRGRLASALDRLEAMYLKVLRAAILLIASFLIIAAIALAGYSVYRITRSPDSVTVTPATVAAADIVDADQVASAPRAPRAQVAIDPAIQRFYGDFVVRYHRLFRNRFEPFRQRADKQLTVTEFGDSYIRPAERMKAIVDGTLAFESDKADLESLFTVMTQAAEHPTTQARLKRYLDARKVRRCETIQRTKTEFESGWDRYASNCAGWYEEPVGCAVTRTVEKPYSVQQCTLEFPPNTQSHAQIFRAFQDRYVGLLEERRQQNSAEADDKRMAIVRGNGEGAGTLMISLQILGGFLVLMFFFLLIAIERHLRRRNAAVLP